MNDSVDRMLRLITHFVKPIGVMCIKNWFRFLYVCQSVRPSVISVSFEIFTDISIATITTDNKHWRLVTVGTVIIGGLPFSTEKLFFLVLLTCTKPSVIQVLLALDSLFDFSYGSP